MNDQLASAPEDSIFDGIDLREWLQIALRRKWLALGVGTMAVLTGMLWLSRVERIYEGSVTLELSTTSPRFLGNQIEDFRDEQVGWTADASEFYETQFRVMRSRPVAERVVTKLGLTNSKLAEEVERLPSEAFDPAEGLSGDTGTPYFGIRRKLAYVSLDRVASKEALLEELKRKDLAAHMQGLVEVSPIRGSKLSRISVLHRNADRAAELANAIAGVYVEYNLEQKVGVANSAVNWLETQLGDLLVNLQDSEQALHDFKQQNNILSVSIEDRQSIFSAQLQSLYGALAGRQAERISIESKIVQLERILKGDADPAVYGEIDRSNALGPLAGGRYELQNQRAELLVKYTDGHPRVQAIHERIEQTRRGIAAEATRILEGLRMSVMTSKDSELRLNLAVEEMKQEAFKLNQKEIDFNRLKRHAANNVELYTMVLKRQKEAQLSQMLKVNNTSILEPALPMWSPVQPRTAAATMVIAAVAFFLSIASVFVAERLDNRVKIQSDIEGKLGLTFLGILPIIRPEGGQEDIQVRDQFAAMNPRSSVAECARSIRTNILFMSGDKKIQTLLVTSSRPKEGKTTTALTMAIAMAQSGTRTLIIDADMRRPRLHRSFGLKTDMGLTSCLIGATHWSQAVQPTGIDNLDVLACGPMPPNPAELLHSERFQALLQDLRKSYGRILMDSPPVCAVTDPLILSNMCDGVLFVLRADETTMPAALEARRQLLSVHSNILGAILNSVDLDDKGGRYYYYYQYRYYRGGYYGYGESENKSKPAA